MNYNQELHLHINVKKHNPLLVIATLMVVLSGCIILTTLSIIVGFYIIINQPAAADQGGSLLNQPVIEKAMTLLRDQTVEFATESGQSLH